MYTCIVMDAQQVENRRTIQTHLTDEELKEVKHRCIDKNESVSKWVTDIIRKELNKEKQTNNAINT